MTSGIMWFTESCGKGATHPARVARVISSGLRQRRDAGRFGATGIRRLPVVPRIVAFAPEQPLGSRACGACGAQLGGDARFHWRARERHAGFPQRAREHGVSWADMVGRVTSQGGKSSHEQPCGSARSPGICAFSSLSRARRAALGTTRCWWGSPWLACASSRSSPCGKSAGDAARPASGVRQVAVVGCSRLARVGSSGGRD